ncbi:MAG: hypothetical protein N3A60_04195 [Thermanaerothrix sp.]|uniref:Pilus assembly protein n=1 Tax=Thermanaerothrix solaris TaxID=3058434 RepID=A0ABU3NRZ6_9CHLR|nr:hypothetical protein [Thermanaerothrix sp. 4228-RoL]MCX8024384.1 hypothetical protein [Thermanaerothrix sp.]MDT8899596.1 hypothetical protein [Thermanaerothrix sp. 4228-RoL]
MCKLERGQAMTEFILFAGLAVILALMLVAFIPIHRARTAATSAAYACAQFLSQSPDPAKAAKNASDVAYQVLSQRWSGLRLARFSVSVSPHGGAGTPGTCTVSWSTSTVFGGILGGPGTVSGSITAVSRSEVWRPKW